MLLEELVNENNSWNLIGQAKELLVSIARVVPDLHGLIEVAKSEELPRMLSVLRDIIDKQEELTQLQKYLPAIQNIAKKLERFM